MKLYEFEREFMAYSCPDYVFRLFETKLIAVIIGIANLLV